MSQSAFTPAQASQRPALPSRHRLALLVLVGVYPLITAIIYGVAPFTVGWEIWQRNLVVAPIMVAAMVYGMIPFIQARFRAFLSAPRSRG
jgi:antibiotic biosynthesis monooxygenase (ABM) superfamily enzyme